MTRLSPVVLSALLLLASAARLSTATVTCSGSVSITQDGVQQQVPVFGSWAALPSSGTTVSAPYNVRGYFGRPGTCSSAYGPNSVNKMQLLGKTLTYTMNMAQAGLGCNAAFYLVSMPSANAGQLGDYYCDANNVGGSSCSEIDLIEANTNAIAVTLHKCNNPTSGCDGNGCGINSRSTGNWFGPGASYTINSLQSFQMSFTFVKSGSSLSDVQLVVSQGSKSFSRSFAGQCGSGYLSALSQAVANGMVPTVSYWGSSGGGMSWLDGSLTATCAQTGTIYISDVVISGGSPPPPINACASNNGGCGSASTTQCTSVNGVARCTCLSGYTGNPPTSACTPVQPVNACANNNGGCGSVTSTDCLSINGVAVCTCKDGYQGNPPFASCTPVDPCANDNGGCGSASTTKCTVSRNLIYCSCLSGFTGSPPSVPCSPTPPPTELPPPPPLPSTQLPPPPTDPCADNNGGCGVASTTKCSSVKGTAICSCLPGYTGNPPTTACTQTPPPTTCAFKATDAGSNNWYLSYNVVPTTGLTVKSVVAQINTGSLAMSGPFNWGPDKPAIFTANPNSAVNLPFQLVVTSTSGAVTSLTITSFTSGATSSC